MLKKKLIIFAGALLALSSCKVDPKIIPSLPMDNLVEVIPEGFPQPVYKFTNNPITDSTFILGRFLFYETMLSKDNSISCGSCHQQNAAFANTDHKVSHGINEQVGKRNSPAIFNVVWAPRFMHDGAIPNIELQPIGPIQNPIEMGENIVTVLDKLRATAKFKALFKGAYGTEEINTQRMFRAMAQFMALMYSYKSKYDHYKRKEGNVTLNEAELKGYKLFQEKCNSCHKEPLFTDYEMRSNGLKVDPLLTDSGKAHITGLPEDVYKFKTPSLRNIAFTAPYMHDGRFSSLEECLDHYTGGALNQVNLDPLLANNGLQMTAQEKQDIIAFLHTLSDYDFVYDKRFANPNFK